MDDGISTKALVGAIGVSFLVGLGVGILVNKRGRDLTLKLRPNGFWKFVSPGVEFHCKDKGRE